LSLRRRLFITLCIIVILGFFSIARWVRGELRNSYAQIVEEVLVDYSHLMSAYLENSKMSAEGFASLQKMFERADQHQFSAKIFDFVKTDSSLDMYVTDDKGVVLYSTKKENIGQDFSKWNDVYKTLRGQYGARSTRIDENDSRTSVYYVAAPIVVDSKMLGVVTISKAESSVLIFLDRAWNKMFMGGLFSVIALGIIGGLIMVWITLPLEKLRKYAIEVSEGQRGVLPQSKIKEVKHLGEAFEKMRISLEGKKTIEKYTQTLTHELKSPLTAIKGAAELCLEEMDSKQREQFLKNIIEEANRSHSFLEQLLKIAALESKRQLEQTSEVDLVEVVNEAKEALMGLWKPKNLNIVIEAKTSSYILGERFLLFQAMRNVIQNAIEFSKNSSNIQIEISEEAGSVLVKVTDEGVGVPDFAKDKIFEKFYSLERPDTKKKSTGLGLSFVKEVVELHKGKIEVISPVRNNQGACFQIQFAKGHA
jgi:two-component system, OmpR family, sensor histidine kinase CreC